LANLLITQKLAASCQLVTNKLQTSSPNGLGLFTIHTVLENFPRDVPQKRHDNFSIIFGVRLPVKMEK